MRFWTPLLGSVVVSLNFVGCCTMSEVVTGDIPVIDTHIHLYDTTRAEGVPWPPEDDQVLYRPVLPKHFDPITRANGVTATVIVDCLLYTSPSPRDS